MQQLYTYNAIKINALGNNTLIMAKAKNTDSQEPHAEWYMWILHNYVTYAEESIGKRRYNGGQDKELHKLRTKLLDSKRSF